MKTDVQNQRTGTHLLGNPISDELFFRGHTLHELLVLAEWIAILQGTTSRTRTPGSQWRGRCGEQEIAQKEQCHVQSSGKHHYRCRVVEQKWKTIEYELLWKAGTILETGSRSRGGGGGRRRYVLLYPGVGLKPALSWTSLTSSHERS